MLKKFAIIKRQLSEIQLVDNNSQTIATGKLLISHVDEVFLSRVPGKID
jgi:hypothetical protein